MKAIVDKRRAARLLYASGCLIVAIVLLAVGDATPLWVSPLVAAAIVWSVVAWRERQQG